MRGKKPPMELTLGYKTHATSARDLGSGLAEKDRSVAEMLCILGTMIKIGLR